MYLRGARQHNLKRVTLELPDDRLVVITGVSGSGKSSLAFDTLYREGQRRYLETLSFASRQHLAKAGSPAVDQIGDLRPAVAVDQRTVIRSPRSTVGTLTELHPHLRLLFARLGHGASGGQAPLESSLFSFNSPLGQCPRCKGLGVEDRVDPQLLVGDQGKTIRQGALVLTTPSGYLVYSQVTMEVLDQVCQAHGFSVDIPWRELTAEQRGVVLDGSDRLVIPYGKHTLESRLRWTGITPRPRQEGHYRGIVPVIEEILKRARNANVLRFVRSQPCGACGGARLRPEALQVSFHGRSIADLAALTVAGLRAFCTGVGLEAHEAPVGAPLLQELGRRGGQLEALGLGHLRLDRGSESLSGGEARRVRLATQLRAGLRGLLYVLDEPSVGLHAVDLRRLLDVLVELRDAGNSVVVVEHDPAAMHAADWLVDIGPGAGVAGGEVLFSGRPNALVASAAESATGALLRRGSAAPRDATPGMDHPALTLRGAAARNLKGIEVSFRLDALNVVSGVAGAGKSTLVAEVLAPALRGEGVRLAAADDPEVTLEGAAVVSRVIVVDQRPIGRTPRSNAATYTKLYDHVRGLFAGLDEARARGLGKGRFSFNNKGGRCEVCQGAGVKVVGMHFLADVEVTCDACGGRRFNEETLAVRYHGHSVADVLALPVDAAAELLADVAPAARLLQALQAVGLGYLPLGQPSTTLSGGEAQRVKLAAELGRASKGGTLYILDEPTVGLHAADVAELLQTLERLVQRGNTVIVVEHDLDVIRAADWLVDLGPGSGDDGGEVVACGPPGAVARCGRSRTGAALRGEHTGPAPTPPPAPREAVELRGVSVNNLRGVDVDIPIGRLTVVTGVSGSGKSSLAFDALVGEGQRRFAACLSTYARRFMRQARRPELTAAEGLAPPVALGQHVPPRNPRSTVGTLCGIYDLYRLLYSRAGVAPDDAAQDAPLSARLFSFNHHSGACPRCRGLGSTTRCDPRRLVTDPALPPTGGALGGTKTGAYYGEPDGQHVAILRAAAAARSLDVERPWRELSPAAQQLCMWGSGDQEHEVVWRYRRGGRAGEHRWSTVWSGFANYVTEEYERKHADRRGEAMRPLMQEQPCEACAGQRLRPEVLAVRFAGRGIGELCALQVRAAQAFFDGLAGGGACTPEQLQVSAQLRAAVGARLAALARVGLPYLTLDRAVSSLSGGEVQRVGIAAQLRGPLKDVIYVLDEPTVGLHPRDTDRLLQTLRALRDGGSTVVLVEHDLEVIRAADHVIDLGPGAGPEGGEVLVVGTPEEVAACPRSITGEYLRARALGLFRARGDAASAVRVRGDVALRATSLAAHADHCITVFGARANNLRGIDVTVPCGGLVAITGVSGSGKTSLLLEVIHASAQRGAAAACDAIEGLERFGEIVRVDRRPAGGGPASTVATVVPRVFDALRGLFARSPEAKALGLTRRHFALGSKGGRCEVCHGAGWTRVGMGFLADVRLTCEACGGARFEAKTLACRPAALDGLSVADLLELTVAQAAERLAGQQAKLTRALSRLSELGLGYLRLGQQTATLSGGEAQRLHLAARLLQRGAKRGSSAAAPVLLLLDEPTAGLHPHDVARLVCVLRGLVQAGDSVLVVEHDLELIGAADHVIDLGPEGGDEGGELVAQGTPTQVAEAAGSHTGVALRGLLSLGGSDSVL